MSPRRSSRRRARMPASVTSMAQARSMIITSITIMIMTLIMAMTTSTRLLQLASPTLPVGAYSYSQGLEAAIEAGLVSDAESAERWIGDVLRFSVAKMDAPILHRMMVEPESIERLNELYLATRETAEFRAETLQMGGSLATLLTDLGLKTPQASFPAA